MRKPLAAPVLIAAALAVSLIAKDRKLTRFNIDAFRRIYAPMMAFTGKFTIDRDERDKVGIIRVEAYLRNAMPAGNYPYPLWHNPFWHNDATWGSFEAMNVMNFYLDDKGRIIVMSRSAVGSDTNPWIVSPCHAARLRQGPVDVDGRVRPVTTRGDAVLHAVSGQQSQPGAPG